MINDNPAVARTFLERARAKLGWETEDFNRRVILACGYRPAVVWLLFSVRLDSEGGEVLRTFLARLANVTSVDDVSQEFDVYLSNLRFRQPRWVRTFRLRISGTRLCTLRDRLFEAQSTPIPGVQKPGVQSSGVV